LGSRQSLARWYQSWGANPASHVGAAAARACSAARIVS
jgi:hypothetical protein